MSTHGATPQTRCTCLTRGQSQQLCRAQSRPIPFLQSEGLGQVEPSTGAPSPPPTSQANAQAEAAKMQVKVCNGGPAKAPGLTELRGCTVALWEALWRGKPSGRGGHDVRREWRWRWWGSSSCRGWSVATWKAGHRVRDSMAHTAPPAQTQVPALWIPFPYQLPVLLAPTFLNRKTKRRWCCVSPTSGLGDKPCAQSTGRVLPEPHWQTQGERP